MFHDLNYLVFKGQFERTAFFHARGRVSVIPPVLRNFGTALLLLVLATSCSKTDGGNRSKNLPPWSKTNFSTGSASMIVNRDESTKFTSREFDFLGIIQSISSHYEVSILVQPSSLLTTGITIEVVGTDVNSVLTSLAKAAGLEIEQINESEWKIFDPNSSEHSSEMVQYRFSGSNPKE